jgi:nicotinate-nucleotide adenylyltransferase
VLPLTVPEIGISSTAIRRRVAEATSIRYWVPEPVAAYVNDRGLYQALA